VTDPARALLEAELTADEIERILRVCGPRALLVGVTCWRFEDQLILGEDGT
jgi:hypothetical protein